MDPQPLIDFAGKGLLTALALSTPSVLTALAIGFMISVFQAVTQIQEQTLTFVPKIIAVFAVLLITGGWMINTITDFTQEAYTELGQYVKS